MSYMGSKARSSYFMLTWTRQMERGRYANCCLIGLSADWSPVKTTVREGESRSESNVENYWIGFSCHSQHISLSNFGSHHDHGSAVSPWKSRFFQPSFREKRQRFSSLLYLTPPPVWLPPPNTDNARKQVFTGSHLCRRHKEDRFECRGGYKTLQWNKILKQE